MPTPPKRGGRVGVQSIMFLLFVGIKKGFSFVYKVHIFNNQKITLELIDSYDDEVKYSSLYSWGNLLPPSIQLGYAILRESGLDQKDALKRHKEFVEEVISKKADHIFILTAEELRKYLPENLSHSEISPPLNPLLEEKIIKDLINRCSSFVSFYRLPLMDPSPQVKKFVSRCGWLREGGSLSFAPEGQKVGEELNFLVERGRRNTFSLYLLSPSAEARTLLQEFYGSTALQKLSIFLEGYIHAVKTKGVFETDEREG